MELKDANLLLRFLLEICTLLALGYWGARVGRRIWAKIGLAIGVPVLAALIWASFVAPNASLSAPGWIRFVLEVLVLGSAAAALYGSRRKTLCWIFILVVVTNRILMTVWGQ